MALRSPSLFLYNLTVTANNSSIDFKISGGGSELNATLRQGYYSLTTLMLEVVRALQDADPSNTYAVTANRTIGGGTQNRVTIHTVTGAFLSLLFSSGTRTASNAAALLGFNVADYTGGLTYTGSASSGTTLLTNREGFTYLPVDAYQNNQGKINISASGQKEAVVFSVMFFFQVQFKYITLNQMLTQWTSLMTWMIQQRPIDYTPEITFPNTFYAATLESTAGDGQGLGFKFTEQLPDFPNQYDTGLMKFRKVPGT